MSKPPAKTNMPAAFHAEPDLDEQDLTFLWAGLPIIAIVFATVVLYCGQQILLPIAMAMILAVIFSPLAGRLEPYVGRMLSSAGVVLLAVTIIAVIGYALAVELTTVADEVSAYSDNIGNKLAKLEATSPPWLQRLKQAVHDVQRRVEKGRPAAAAPIQVQTQTASEDVVGNLGRLVPLLDDLVEVMLIIVLLFFLLYSRRDLRDRFVRLVARARIPVAPQALETAAYTVGHYLLLFALTNLGFGLACGTAAWLFGLPSAALWGLLAFLLRFIPYVGAMTAALLPALVAFALFPGWGRSIGVIGSFVLFDQIAGQVVEPFIVGPGIDLSPAALLVSAMYWSWIWGVPGLLLATPLTACLKVAGDYVPALGFLSVLLRGDRELDDYHDFYRMLLELDATGAREQAIRYCDEHGIEQTFDDVLIPALILSGEERAADHISHSNQILILETIRGLIGDLGNRFRRPPARERLRILGICPPGEVHNLGLLMVLELLRHAGAAAKLVEDSKSPAEVREFVKSFTPQLVCVSCTLTECVAAAVGLVIELKQDSPNLTIIAGGKAALWDTAKFIEAGCTEVCGSREETRRAMRRFAVTRAKSRLRNQHEQSAMKG